MQIHSPQRLCHHPQVDARLDVSRRGGATGHDDPAGLYCHAVLGDDAAGFGERAKGVTDDGRRPGARHVRRPAGLLIDPHPVDPVPLWKCSGVGATPASPVSAECQVEDDVEGLIERPVVRVS